jgi:hypothetical protein
MFFNQRLFLFDFPFAAFADLAPLVIHLPVPLSTEDTTIIFIHNLIERLFQMPL